MPNQITNVPGSVSSAGLDFNYAAWTPGTQVTMCNVPWNSDYRDIVRFANQAALDTYLTTQTGPVVTITGMTYARFGFPVRLNIPFNRAFTYNYLRVFNPAQPVTDDIPRAFYYFITAVNYVNPGTTELMIQLDVWQTFGYGITFGNCYIERGHIGIAQMNNFDGYGQLYLTQPEGLDIGNEYKINAQYSRAIASARGPEGFSIMVTSTTALDVDPGTVDAPNLQSARGSDMENLPNGAEIYIFDTMAKFKTFMSEFSDKPWVTQGIISIMAIPPWSEYSLDTSGVVVGTQTILKAISGTPTTIRHKLRDSWRDDVIALLPTRYQHLKKFLTFPYLALELTTYAGTPLVLKPEAWGTEDLEVIEVPHFAPPGARLIFYPYRYNGGNYPAFTDGEGVYNDGAEFLDMATGIFDFPTFSIVNNGYMSFMAANTHGIAFQHQNADWSQQKAMTGNALSFDQASSGIELSKELNRLNVNAATQSTALANQTAAFRGIQGLVGGGINGAAGMAAGGPPGMAAGALMGMANGVANYAIETNQNNQALGISTNLANRSNAATTGQGEYMRDTNKSYADFAAKGDYQNAIAAINARVQDARLIQPSTSGQIGGNAFNLAMYRWGYDVKVKMLQFGAQQAIGEYWLRYGYAINQFGKVPLSLHCMQKFTYWKLRETYITGSACPESFKQAIRGIFEKGVTVWQNPADIGNIDIGDNAPLEGIVL